MRVDVETRVFGDDDHRWSLHLPRGEAAVGRIQKWRTMSNRSRATKTGHGTPDTGLAHPRHKHEHTFVCYVI